MNPENPTDKIAKWWVALPFVLILIVKIIQSHLTAHGRSDLAAFFGIAIFAMPLLGFIILLYLWAFLGTPPIDPLTEEKMDLIKCLIDECLKEIDRKLMSASKRLIEKGVFHVTYLHARRYLKEVAYYETQDHNAKKSKS